MRKSSSSLTSHAEAKHNSMKCPRLLILKCKTKAAFWSFPRERESRVRRTNRTPFSHPTVKTSTEFQTVTLDWSFFSCPSTASIFYNFQGEKTSSFPRSNELPSHRHAMNWSLETALEHNWSTPDVSSDPSPTIKGRLIKTVKCYLWLQCHLGASNSDPLHTALSQILEKASTK